MHESWREEPNQNGAVRKGLYNKTIWKRIVLLILGHHHGIIVFKSEPKFNHKELISFSFKNSKGSSTESSNYTNNVKNYATETLFTPCFTAKTTGMKSSGKHFNKSSFKSERYHLQDSRQKQHHLTQTANTRLTVPHPWKSKLSFSCSEKPSRAPLRMLVIPSLCYWLLLCHPLHSLITWQIC